MQTVKNLAILGAVVFALPVQADDVKTLKPVTTPPVPVEWIDPVDRPITDQASGPTTDPAAMADACPATPQGILSLGGGSWSGDTTGRTDNFDDDYPAACTYGRGNGGIDEIHSFQVSTSGVWNFNTSGACWDTSLGVRRDTGAGCPGNPVACDGDRLNDCFYESSLDVFLVAGTDYFIVADGYQASQFGPYTLNYSLVLPSCTSDAACDDGDPCNGAESCDLAAGGQCLQGTPPCHTPQTCNPDGSCTDPDGSLIYQSAALYGWSSLGGGTEGTLVGDDWGFASGNLGRELKEYNVAVFGTAANYVVATMLFGHGLNCIGGSFEGDQCDVDADCPGFFCVGGANDGLPCATTNPDCPGVCDDRVTPCFADGECPYYCNLGDCPTDGTCVDEGFYPVVGQQRPAHTGEIPGTLCVFTNLPAGYFHTLSCSPVPGVTLPADGVWQVMGFVNTGGAAGPALAGGPPQIGTSTDIFAWDLGSNGANWARYWFVVGNLANWAGDLRTEPVGACCTPGLGGSCSILTEADCTADGGALVGFNNAVRQFDCDADADDDGTVDPCDDCTDSDGDGFGDPGFPTNTCPDDACPDNPEFTADADGDDPGDLSCLDCIDACPNEATFCADTGPCNCSTSDVDGDGTLDCVDACPNNPDFAADQGPCQCNSSDRDNDGCLDCVDACPDDPAKCSDDGTCGCGVDDNADTDGDGVPDCIDQCNGVDDAVFAPECDGVIPTVSEWGLVILVLLLLAAGKVYFGRSSATA